MQQKIISFIIGTFFGIGLCFGYQHFFIPSHENLNNFENRNFSGGRGDFGGIRGGFGSGELNQEQKEQMAQRFGISLEELEKDLESGKTIQEMMQERGVFGGFERGQGGGQRGNFGGGETNNQTPLGE